MGCAESLQLQAYFDGEVDPAAAGAIERHLETCVECRALLQDLHALRTLLREQAVPIGIPADLRGRIMASLDEESRTAVAPRGRPSAPLRRSRPFWIGVISGVGGGALAAALALLVLAPMLKGSLVTSLVADHTRSLMSSHLIDVVSTDQHTVKPWFAGRVELSPAVADFAPQGYRLLGGRVDEVQHSNAAVVVYQHGKHVINVFSWVIGRGGLPQDVTRNGYHLAFWQDGNLAYCAVSDTGWPELHELVGLLQGIK